MIEVVYGELDLSDRTACECSVQVGHRLRGIEEDREIIVGNRQIKTLLCLVDEAAQGECACVIGLISKTALADRESLIATT